MLGAKIVFLLCAEEIVVFLPVKSGLSDTVAEPTGLPFKGLGIKLSMQLRSLPLTSGAFSRRHLRNIFKQWHLQAGAMLAGSSVLCKTEEA